MRNNLLRIFFICSLTLNLSVFITAGYLYFKNDDGSYNTIADKAVQGGHLFDVLSLNNKQRSRMIKLASEFHRGLDRQRAEILPLKVELINELRKENPDNKQIESIINSVNVIQRRIQEATVTHLIQSKKALDKEQHGKLLELIEKSLPEGDLPECPL